MNVWYMNGAGNDFMVIDARGKTYDFKQLALDLCKITGADGFMAVDHSDKADFKLHFYNSDGTRGEMCGNGARCICRYAYDNGIAGENMVVETDAGLVPGWRLSENQYKVQLNNPGVLDLRRKPDAAYVELGDPGVPHAVREVPGLRWEDGDALKEMACALRHDPAFPKGANANLYTWTGENEVRILTFERGVEDYTLACGTGSGSVAVTLWAEGKLPGGRLAVHNQGGTLTVTIEGSDGKVNAIYLEGPTEVVREYEI
ncbi:MAG: diaminopimelate epimerase [Oscillospiraceae bacterium]|nr:diaminopimelate epimerase [Oscillospiraceae bacterium]